MLILMFKVIINALDGPGPGPQQLHCSMFAELVDWTCPSRHVDCLLYAAALLCS
jgi:hypothetical protein